MDFILTVVDRLSKYAHFITLAHPYTATTVAAAFFEQIVRLHGVLASIVPRPCLHQHSVVGDLLPLRDDAMHELCVQAADGWTIGGDEPDNHDLPVLPSRRPP
jgi:hypothetical protein